MTSYTYDGNGNVLTITDPLNNTRTLTYDPIFNKVTSITDPLGNLTTFEYDAQGNLVTVTDPLNSRTVDPSSRLSTTFTYNSAGQPLTTTDPLGNTASFAYDAAGNLVGITDPLGNTVQRSYDVVSRLLAQTDPLGNTTRFSYDPLNRLAQIVDPLNGTIAFGYDPNGNLLTVTDARGNTITHEYDSMDHLSRRVDQLGKAETFTYDGNGNLVSTTDRKNQTSTFTYDPLNRRVRAEYADGAIATFQYDAGGRLLVAGDTQDPHRPITMSYDALNRLLAETTSLGTVSYAYDTISRRTAMTVSGQASVTYSYDHNSRLRTITQAPLNPVDIQYDALGRRTLLALPNGVSTEYVYDLGSRLTALIYRNTLGLLGDLTYQYDATGNRIAVGGSFARTLLPDTVPASNYDAANRQLGFSDKTMAFDDNGNLASITTAAGTTTYTWDSRNRLTGIGGPSLGAGFLYDALGRRAMKTINGETTSFLYDGFGVALENGASGVASYLRTLVIDEALLRSDASVTLAYLADALGSTVALADATGALPTTYTYAPFGDSGVSGSPSANPLQFTGRENDGTGLYYYRARYYAPTLARFVSEDPWNYGQHRAQLARLFPGPTLGGLRRILLRDPDSRHGFGYAAQNPLSNSDPLGLQAGPGRAGAMGAKAGAGVPFPGGPGAAVGAAIGGVTGVALGSELGPGAIATGIGGAIIGGWVGSLFDPACAGSLNCGEEQLAREWERRQQMEEEIAQIQRDLDRMRQLLERLDRITQALEEIVQGRGKP